MAKPRFKKHYDWATSFDHPLAQQLLHLVGLYSTFAEHATLGFIEETVKDIEKLWRSDEKFLIKGYISNSIVNADRERYQAWINANTPIDPSRLCRVKADEMAKAFPELKVFGKEHVAGGGHAWCQTSKGEIVDPTAHQYFFYYDYDEAISVDRFPIGKCMECGEMVYNDSLHAPNFCCEECSIEYGASLKDL